MLHTPPEPLLSSRFLTSVGGQEQRLVLLVLNFRLPSVTFALWKHGDILDFFTLLSILQHVHCIVNTCVSASLELLHSCCSPLEGGSRWGSQSTSRHCSELAQAQPTKAHIKRLCPRYHQGGPRLHTSRSVRFVQTTWITVSPGLGCPVKA